MKKIIALSLIIMASTAQAEWYFPYALEIGQCNSNITMCHSGEPKFHLMVGARYRWKSGFNAGVSAHHFSMFDGSDDFDQNSSGQTGTFDFIGVGIAGEF